MRRRTLALRRETIGQLATTDLESVVAAQYPTPVVRTIPVNDCISDVVITCTRPPSGQPESC